jgi:hypothetical protein
VVAHDGILSPIERVQAPAFFLGHGHLVFPAATAATLTVPLLYHR